jgi:hypothetical protein
MDTICGIDCGVCSFSEVCGGCRVTGGKPFGGDCMLASCCAEARGQYSCSKCGFCGLKKQIINEFNSLGIEDMDTVTELYPLRGAFVNLEYTFPGGNKVKFWDDDKIYLGGQIHKNSSCRCYGLTADENYLLVCEYGDEGENPEVVAFVRRAKRQG